MGNIFQSHLYLTLGFPKQLIWTESFQLDLIFPRYLNAWSASKGIFTNVTASFGVSRTSRGLISSQRNFRSSSSQPLNISFSFSCPRAAQFCREESLVPCSFRDFIPHSGTQKMLIPHQELIFVPLHFLGLSTPQDVLLHGRLGRRMLETCLLLSLSAKLVTSKHQSRILHLKWKIGPSLKAGMSFIRSD